MALSAGQKASFDKLGQAPGDGFRRDGTVAKQAPLDATAGDKTAYREAVPADIVAYRDELD